MRAKNTNAIHPALWPVQNVQAFISTRHHPFKSNSPTSPFTSVDKNTNFADFNLGIHVSDDLAKVEKNRQSLLKLLPKHTPIQWLNQVHGNKVHLLTKYSSKAIEADAIVTKRKNIALAIMTADCLPIFISDENGSEIAAIHGGWRPLSQNIIARTLAKMTTNTEQFYVWLGPCIGSKAFEVGEEVRQVFIEQSIDFMLAFELLPNLKNNQSLKYLANLQLIATIQLRHLGIKHISTLNHCTYTMSDDYYSFRRENITGRMVSIICRL